MSTQSITLNLPAPLYERLTQRARQAHRSVEDELLEVVATAVPATDALPEDLRAAIAPLPLLDDDPLEAYIGAFPSDIADWGEEHDKYLGAAILEHGEGLNTGDGQPDG